MSGPKVYGKKSPYRKKWLRCLGPCGKMIYTDCGHRICTPCRKRIKPERVPPRMASSHAPTPDRVVKEE